MNNVYARVQPGLCGLSNKIDVAGINFRRVRLLDLFWKMANSKGLSLSLLGTLRSDLFDLDYSFCHVLTGMYQLIGTKYFDGILRAFFVLDFSDFSSGG